MNLSLTDEQQQIADSAAIFLADASPMSAVRATSLRTDGIDPELWHGIGELGWCGVHLPEGSGGLGLGLVELALLQEQLGLRLACVPFFDSVVLAASALRELTDSPVAQDCLRKLATGVLIATLALPEGAACQATARLVGTGWVLEGDWPLVGSAAMAHVLLLPAQSAEGEILLFAVSANAPGLQVRSLATLDTTRRMAAVKATAIDLPVGACIGRGDFLDSLLQRVTQLGAIALAAEQVGIAQQCLDLTLAYAGQRSQFGRPIASFQAVKHRCAQMLVMLEGARSAVYGAACTADTSPNAAVLLFHAAQARVAATEAAQFCSREAIQLHGGVGFTWAFDPHLYLRRSQASSQRLGPVTWWLEQVAAQMLDAPEENS